MRYTHYAPFRQHVEADFPSSRLLIYVILLKEHFDRKWIAQQLLNKLTGWERVSVSHHQLKNAILTPDFWCDHTCLLSHHSGKEGNFDALIPLCTPLPPHTRLILSSDSDRPFTTFYSSLSHQTVMLDLLQEKPWEKQARFRQWINDYLHEQGKQGDQEAIDDLLATKPTDFSWLQSEVEKLSVFLGGDETPLSKKVIKKMGDLSSTLSLWKISEKLIWEPQGINMSEILKMEMATVRQIIHPLRYYLRLGRLIAHSIEQNETLDLKPFYPSLYPHSLKKYHTLSRNLKEDYFIQGMKHLYHVEYRIRSGAPPLLMITWMVAQLKQLSSVPSPPFHPKEGGKR